MYFAFSWKYLPIWILITAIVIFLVIFSLFRLEKQRHKRIQKFVEYTLVPRLSVGVNPLFRKLTIFAVVAGIFFLILTLAQPHWGSSWEKTQKLTRDILFVIDTSESMLAEDLPPNRLEQARQKVSILMSRCPADRFGIIAFSGESALVCPLTLDHAYVKTILRALNTDMLSKEGTDISDALNEVEQVFKEDIQKSGGGDKYARAVIIMSDGEDLSENVELKAESLGENVSLIVLGMGTPEGAEIKFPEWMKRYVRTSNLKQVHKSVLDEKKLKDIAIKGNGFYVRATMDDSDINLILNELEKIRLYYQSDELRYQKVNRYRWPLFIACIIFCFENVLWLMMTYRKNTSFQVG
ncbi:MAG TPA: VWA domain-containing protein [Candidatus Hydrogenedens sp.]|mgnify:CR=1 FL=1|nr:VWA domain-containing protein [Candidatus Hydrogenedens sp.]HOK08054.1 VWA domain-containing protein [Candidatus Hydrogenedens sp.]HOL19352.1 VWA domain-containing protein [Candidatus Hydrogenedens sp.]HPP57952.1 VWA domain-containing protein [Candidatus Hydrogenedens sp.]